jgi:hypothetical protein
MVLEFARSFGDSLALDPASASRRDQWLLGEDFPARWLGTDGMTENKAETEAPGLD